MTGKWFTWGCFLGGFPWSWIDPGAFDFTFLPCIRDTRLTLCDCTTRMADTPSTRFCIYNIISSAFILKNICRCHQSLYFQLQPWPRAVIHLVTLPWRFAVWIMELTYMWSRATPLRRAIYSVCSVLVENRSHIFWMVQSGGYLLFFRFVCKSENKNCGSGMVILDFCEVWNLRIRTYLFIRNNIIYLQGKCRWGVETGWASKCYSKY